LAGGSYCLGFGGRGVDRRLEEEILRALAPQGLRASVEAAARMESEDDDRKSAIERQIEQLEYEARRAFEQYDEVDPRRRLVADELERRWNEKLAEFEKARAILAEAVRRRPRISDKEREEVLAMGEQFEEVWRNPACPIELKKKIVRTIVEEVIANEESPGRLKFIIHWKGGTHTAFEMDRLTGTKKNAAEDIEIIRKMAQRYGDKDIARVLSKLGRRTGKDKPWSEVSVKAARRTHCIAGHTRTVEDPEMFTFNGAARYLKVSNTTIVRLAKAGVIPTQQVAPFAPWEIRKTDLDSPEVQSIVERLRRTGHLELEGESSARQGKLFE
jgi:hypothetical protein